MCIQKTFSSPYNYPVTVRIYQCFECQRQYIVLRNHQFQLVKNRQVIKAMQKIFKWRLWSAATESGGAVDRWCELHRVCSTNRKAFVLKIKTHKDEGPVFAIMLICTLVTLATQLEGWRGKKKRGDVSVCTWRRVIIHELLCRFTFSILCLNANPREITSTLRAGMRVCLHSRENGVTSLRGSSLSIQLLTKEH